MSALTNTEQSLLAEATDRFASAYKRPAECAAIAPGRVNLIGDHTDYTDGLCLPFAIDRYVVLVAARATGTKTTLRSSRSRDVQTLSTTASPQPIVGNWSDYVRGVVEGLREHDVEAPALDILIHSNLPSGAGLSSSAALEVGAAHLFLAAAGKQLSNATIVALAQQAEHRYAGVPCGTMDQFSVANGVAGSLLVLDNRSLTADTVTLDDDSIAFLVIDSGVSHDLSDGGYASRRASCEAAEKALGKSLRDTSLEELDAGVPDAVDRKRATHVVSENARVAQMVQALAAGDRNRIAALMYAGHESLRDDFENSVPEVDLLVALASEMSHEGVVGARMTGGGFGGAVIVPIATDNVANVTQTLLSKYKDATQIGARSLVVQPSQGARDISGALTL